ncbi:MAG: argininosuccinate lyase, partial [Limosilactobacillus fermentum]
MAVKRMWGGRFEATGAKWVEEFGASISFDQQMAAEDLEGSLAHVTMLKETKILPAADADQIITGLKKLQDQLEAGELTFTVENEDIHMN